MREPRVILEVMITDPANCIWMLFKAGRRTCETREGRTHQAGEIVCKDAKTCKTTAYLENYQVLNITVTS